MEILADFYTWFKGTRKKKFKVKFLKFYFYNQLVAKFD
jgi:hypothetical protein